MSPALLSLRSLFHLGVAAFALLATDAAAKITPPKDAPLVKVGEFHLKYARQGAAAAVLGDCIYVFGGNAGGAVTTVERSNTRTSRLDQLSDRLLPRRYHSVLEHAGKFDLFGGEGYGLPGNPLEHAVEFLFGDYDDLDSVMAYNLRTRQSVKFKTGFKGARHTTAVVCGDRIYVVGGDVTTENGNEMDLIQVFAANPEYTTK